LGAKINQPPHQPSQFVAGGRQNHVQGITELALEVADDRLYDLAAFKPTTVMLF